MLLGPQHCALERSFLAVGLLAFGIAGFLGNALGGYLTDRMGAARTVRTGLLALGLCMLGLVATAELAAAVCLVACAFTGSLLTVPQVTELVADQPPSRYAAIHALNVTALTAGMALGAATAALVIPLYGYSGLIVSALVLLLISALWHERTVSCAPRADG